MNRLIGFMKWGRSTTFRRVDRSEYDRVLQAAFDLSTNRLTDIGAKLHYHDDTVNSEDYNWPDGEPHPADLLEAQIDMDGAEEEAEVTRDLVNILGSLIAIRKSRI
jgi:hypothetical protein